jgi:hypothetical protein
MTTNSEQRLNHLEALVRQLRAENALLKKVAGAGNRGEVIFAEWCPRARKMPDKNPGWDFESAGRKIEVKYSRLTTVGVTEFFQWRLCWERATTRGKRELLADRYVLIGEGRHGDLHIFDLSPATMLANIRNADGMVTNCPYRKRRMSNKTQWLHFAKVTPEQLMRSYNRP